MKKVLPWLLVIAAPAVLAQAPATPKIDNANTAWMLVSAALVLFMTLPGLALFYAGLVRTKNVLSVVMQCFSITGVVRVGWVAVGYRIAGGDANAWGGGRGKGVFSGLEGARVRGAFAERVWAG